MQAQAEANSAIANGSEKRSTTAGGRARHPTRIYTAEDDEYPMAWLRRIGARALWTQYNYWTAACLCLVLDAFLTGIIVLAVRYTEIDFNTYMQQTQIFLKGERRYDRITGDTGPCVYPALHLYINSALSFLSNDGSSIVRTQCVYAVLYLASQLCTMAIYKAARIPPIMLPVLALSKRLHSIYVLRLFNDCWAVVLMYAAIWAMCKGRWSFASSLYSLALGVKMNILLYAPAMAAIYLRALGVQGSAVEAVKVVLIQLLLGGPFLLHDAKAYASSSFDLSRAFLYKWTVNWRLVSEQTFLDKRFANALLALHATSVLLWLTYRWTGVGAPGGGMRWLRLMLRKPSSVQTSTHVSRRPSGRFIVSALFVSNLLGITFARSLHYQFYSWYAQQIPALVYLARLPIALKAALPLAIEVAWNTYPSTSHSSALLHVCHALLLLGMWRGRHDDAMADEVRQDGATLERAALKEYDVPPPRRR